MKLFNKKRSRWWETGHATSKKMSKVEKMLHDNWLAYSYDEVDDCFFVSLERMETGNHRLNCIISRPSLKKIRITSYTALPMIAKADENMCAKFLEIKKKSDFTNLQVEDKYGFLVCTHDFEASDKNEWLPYIVPVMLEHARVIDENYADICQSYPKDAHTSFPYIFSISELKIFRHLTLNKIGYIDNEIVIIHQKPNN